MATLFTKYSSWVIDGSVSARFKLECTYTQSSAALKSEITENLYLEISGSGQARATDIALTGTGVNLSILSIPFKTATYLIGSNTKTILHKAKNGSASFTSAVTGTIIVNGGSGAYETATIPSFTATLPTLDVYNDLSFNSSTPTMSDTLTITIAKAPASAKTIISVIIDNTTTQIYEGTGTSTTWNVPGTAELLALCVNTDYVPITITSVAYNSNNTQLGTKQYTIKAYLPATITPNMSMTASNSNIAINTFVIGKSMLQFNLVADMTDDEGATISGYSIVVREKNAAGAIIYSAQQSTTASSYTFTMATAITTASTYVVATIMDSRGRNKAITATYAAVAYIEPQIAVSAVRCEANGTPSETGAYIKISATWNVESVSGENEIVGDLKFYLSTDNVTFIQVATSVQTTLTGNVTLTTYPALSVASNGYLYATIEDIFVEAQSNRYLISKSSVAFALYDDGHGNVGASFGKVPSGAGTEITNAKSISTSDGIIAEASKVLFTGAILGLGTITFSEDVTQKYDYLRVYARSYAGNMAFDISLKDHTNAATSTCWQATDWYRGCGVLTEPAAAETHFCNASVSQNGLTFRNCYMGYYKGTSVSARNNNGAYNIFRIVGYKRLS